MRGGGLFRGVPSNPAFAPIRPIPTILLYMRMLLLSAFSLNRTTSVEMISPWDDCLSTDIFAYGRQILRYLTQSTPSPIYVHFPDLRKISLVSVTREPGYVYKPLAQAL